MLSRVEERQQKKKIDTSPEKESDLTFSSFAPSSAESSSCYTLSKVCNACTFIMHVMFQNSHYTTAKFICKHLILLYLFCFRKETTQHTWTDPAKPARGVKKVS